MVRKHSHKPVLIILLTAISIILSLLPAHAVHGQDLPTETATLEPTAAETATPAMTADSTSTPDPAATPTAPPNPETPLPATLTPSPTAALPIDPDDTPVPWIESPPVATENPGAPKVFATSIFVLNTDMYPLSLNPTQSYLLRVTVRDSEGIGQLQNVIVKFWYDQSGVAFQGSEFDSVEETRADYFKITWMRKTNSVSYWSSGSDWYLIDARVPSKDELADPTVVDYNFEFKITIGKTARQTLAGERWQYASFALDQANDSTYLPYQESGVYGFAMNWYGEVRVPAAQLDWGLVKQGMGMSDPASQECMTEGVIYISNGQYYPAVKASPFWFTENMSFLTLSENPLDPDSFAMRASLGTVKQPAKNAIALDSQGSPVNLTSGEGHTADTGRVFENICFYLGLSDDISSSGLFNGTISFVIHN